MTEQCRVVKDLLLHNFPSEHFSVSMRRARDYALSSDTIRVWYSNVHLPVDKVVDVLRRNSRNIAVDRTGKVQVSLSDEAPVMLDIKTNKFIDFDVCEFIEVENDYLDIRHAGRWVKK